MFTFKYIINLTQIKGKYRVSKIIFQNKKMYDTEYFLMSNNQIFRLIDSIDKSDYQIN